MAVYEVYHGSKSNFNQFNFGSIGQNGTSEGKGFYFTNKKGVALSYAGNGGYLYYISLHSNKPIYAYERNISRSELKLLLDTLHELNNYYSNWGDIEYEGYSKIVNHALDVFMNYDDDVEIISALANECGSIEMVNTAIYNTLGYDLIIDNSPKWEREQTIYVALVNDIIEIEKIEQIN